MGPKQVISYRRISTDESKQRHSLDVQEDLIEKFCLIKNWNIVLDLKEEHSAKNFERPKWKLALEFIKKNKGKIDAIIVTKWDRFARNTEFALSEMRKLNKMGVEIICIEQPLDFTNPDNKLMLNLLLTFGEVENDKNSIRTTEGSREARLKGYWTGTPPFGYKNFRDALGQSTLRPGENAQLVTEIFREMAKGIYPADNLRKLYLSKGHKLPSKQSFLDMLRNKAYIGIVTVKKYKNYPSEEVPGLHPPIVDVDTFDKVQRLMNRRRKGVELIRPKGDFYPLKGFVVCPEFEHRLVAYKTTKPNGKEYHYYECQKCRIRYRAEILEAAFENYLRKFQIKEEVLNLYLKMVEDVLEHEDGSRKQEVKKLESRVEELDLMLEKLGYKLASDQIDVKDYREIKSSLERERNDVVMNVTERKMEKAPIKSYLRYANQLLPNIAGFYKQANNELKVRMIGSIFPEKFTFEDSKLRTTKLSSLFSIISMNINDIQKIKNKKTGENSGQSGCAPPPRLERGTP